MPKRGAGLLAVIGPGLLVAATGVGAGDLATAGFAGGRLGVAILWAVVVGALIKYVLNEGLARWQLATGQTLLEGVIDRWGPGASVLFAVYLLPWSFFVGAALISACGVTAHALAPDLIGDGQRAKLVFGAGHSAVGVVLVWFGGFRVFERVMAGCIGVMVAAVVLTAVLLRPDWSQVAAGLAWPRIPAFSEGGLTWTIAVLGGVGGTLTVLCYGYWIREKRRSGPGDLRRCRIDLAVAYSVTALFGLAMVIIASGVPASGRGANLIVDLAGRLEGPLGPLGRWIFLVGAWAAVFSSLLGVWQAVPYIFADFWGMQRRTVVAARRGAPLAVSTRSLPYRGFLVAIATIPLLQVSHPFRDVQKCYAVIGAGFIPVLALVLLLLNNRPRWVGDRLRNGALTNVLLAVALALAVLAGVFQIRQAL